MIDLELPLKKRSRIYRFFEIVPGALSYGMIAVLIILSIVSPFVAAIYLLLLILTLFIKSIGIAFHTIRGHGYLVKAQRVDWHRRLEDLEDPIDSYEKLSHQQSSGFGYKAHQENLRLIAADADNYPKPSQLYQMVFIAAYNEDYDVIQPTIESVRDTTYNNKQIILCL
ncbi:MAG TPA: hypothetical protein PL191_01400, partial [Candidatus Saccharimonas sp.]|nr:hypothetical protein [Candidatus Saccharimonas sp.]